MWIEIVVKKQTKHNNTLFPLFLNFKKKQSNCGICLKKKSLGENSNTKVKNNS